MIDFERVLVPGFALSTLGEAYLRWADKHLDGTAGNQSFNAKWAQSSDSRIKPALFQGIDAKLTFRVTSQSV